MWVLVLVSRVLMVPALFEAITEMSVMLSK